MTPTSQLLAAIAGFLREDVQPELAGSLAYQNRICINLLQILQREARLGGALAELDQRCLAATGIESGGAPELARALRDQRLVPDQALADYLRRRSLLNLAIDNPRYSGNTQALLRWPELAAWLAQLDGSSAID